MLVQKSFLGFFTVFSGSAIDDGHSVPILTREDGDGEGDLSTIVRDKVKKPSLYKVLMYNDDYTTMEFVILVLQTVFGKTTDEAHAIMLKVHHEGVGLCGIYTYEVAETKVNKVENLSRKHGHPLKCDLEQE